MALKSAYLGLLMPTLTPQGQRAHTFPVLSLWTDWEHKLKLGEKWLRVAWPPEEGAFSGGSWPTVHLQWPFCRARLSYCHRWSDAEGMARLSPSKATAGPRQSPDLKVFKSALLQPPPGGLRSTWHPGGLWISRGGGGGGGAGVALPPPGAKEPELHSPSSQRRL